MSLVTTPSLDRIAMASALLTTCQQSNTPQTPAQSRSTRFGATEARLVSKVGVLNAEPDRAGVAAAGQLQYGLSSLLLRVSDLRVTCG